MTARYLLALALAFGLGTAGCTGTTTKDTAGDDDDTVGDDDDSVGTPTGETGGTTIGPGGFDVKYLILQGDMGFDAATNSLVDVVVGGGSIPPAAYILLGTQVWRDANFDLALDTEYCAIILPMTSSALATWASTDPTVWYGVDYVDGVGGVLTNCNTPGFEVDPAILGPDPVGTIINDYGGWGIGVGEWGANFYNYYDTATTPDFFASYVGARIFNVDFVGADDFLSFPVELDPVTFEAQVDAGAGVYIGVPAADVYTGTGIATAWYRVFGLFLYTF